MAKTTLSRVGRFRRTVLTVAACFALSPAAVMTAVTPRGALSLQEDPDVFTIHYGGRAGPVGIPSWKIVLRRDHAGNITDLRVPYDSPASLAYPEDSLWPPAVLATSAVTDLPATMSNGRENFVLFPVDTFAIAEKSAEKIVVRVGGPSKNKLYEQHRTYTFTPAGVQIEGEVLSLINLREVSLKTRWDRRQIADSHVAALPVRTQGRPGWLYLSSSGRDGATPLPAGVKFPLKAELRLRRPAPTFVKIVFDRNFESSKNEPLLIHNDKDVGLQTGETAYLRTFSIIGGPAPKGQKQTFKVRYEFETRRWP